MRHALLGLLAERPGHQYDLLKRLQERWGPAADVNPGSVNSAIAGLTRDRLIAASAGAAGTVFEEHPRRGPTYRITRAGVEEWERWLRTPSQPEPIRSELALKLALCRLPEDAAAVEWLLDDYERSVLDRIAEHAAAADRAPDLLAAEPMTAQALVYQRTTRLLSVDLEWVRDVRHAFRDDRERSQ